MVQAPPLHSTTERGMVSSMQEKLQISEQFIP